MSFSHKNEQGRGSDKVLKSLTDFAGNWPLYKDYLAKNGALSPNLSVGVLFPEKPIKPAQTANVVPWFGKLWPNFTDADKAALRQHFSEMTPQKARNYRLYLINYAGMPRDFYGAE